MTWGAARKDGGGIHSASQSAERPFHGGIKGARAMTDFSIFVSNEPVFETFHPLVKERQEELPVLMHHLEAL